MKLSKNILRFIVNNNISKWWIPLFWYLDKMQNLGFSELAQIAQKKVRDKKIQAYW